MTQTLASPVLGAETEKALRLPVGVSSPLWFMIGSAAVMGAAVFWATSWMRSSGSGAGLAQPKSLPKPEPEVQAAAEKAVASVASAAEAMTDVVQTVAEAVAAPTVAATEAVAPAETVIDPVIAQPVLAPAAAPEIAANSAPAELPADDLTVMTGIGPKMSAMLAERGITRFAQIAAWSDDEIATLDKDMKLMGRVVREAWVAQAKRLAG